MIKMTHVSGGKKVEMEFDTIDELAEFLEKNPLDTDETEYDEDEAEDDEESLEAEETRAELYELFAKVFLKSKEAGFSSDALFDLMNNVLEALVDGGLKLDENGELFFETKDEKENCSKDGCKGCGSCKGDCSGERSEDCAK